MGDDCDPPRRPAAALRHGAAEEREAEAAAAFALPRATGSHGSGTEDYYFFSYDNAIFVARSTEGFSGGSTPFADQAAWLDEVLKNNPKKWRFVYFHKPM